MKQNNPNRLYNHLLWIIIFISLGCYEPTEGCLEVWATNYDVLADNLCDDCCTPPELRVRIQYVLADDSTQYRFGDTLRLADESYVTLHSANVMLSHFEVTNQGDLLPAINDSITIDEIKYEQDFGFSNGQGSAISLTRYQEPFTVDGMTFQQGIPLVWQDTSLFGADNVIIAQAIDSLYVLDDDKFALFSCTISQDTINQDTLHHVSSFSDTIDYALDFSERTLLLGDNTTLTLKVNVVNWLGGVVLDTAQTGNVADDLITTLSANITVD